MPETAYHEDIVNCQLTVVKFVKFLVLGFISGVHPKFIAAAPIAHPTPAPRTTAASRPTSRKSRGDSLSLAPTSVSRIPAGETGGVLGHAADGDRPALINIA